MKPAPFRYERGESVAHVADLLAEHAGDARVLAGGQTLVPLMVLRMAFPEVLVDITRVPELAHLRDDGDLVVGAATTQADLEDHPGLAGRFDALADGLPLVAHREIRNLGTVCGSLAHGDPAAELPAVALALGAELELASSAGRRTVPAADFFEAPYTTACRGDELVTAARFPSLGDRAASAFVEVADSHSGIAIVGAAAAVATTPDGAVAWARVALAGAAGTPLLVAATAPLAGQPLDDDTIEEVALRAADEADPPADARGDARYRRHLARVLTRRALRRCRDRLGGAPDLRAVA